MEEEIKKAYMDWSEKGVSYLNCMYVYDIMMDVDEALQTCDTILDEIDLGIDYTSRKKDIDRLLEGHGTLHRYIDVLNCYVDDKLDQPLKKDFKKNATETISRIHLEDFEVDNTLGLTENNYITGGMGYAGTMVEQEKAKLTFADFIGTSDGKADGNGLHMAYTNGSVEDFASIFAAQYEAMKASGALGEDNNLTQQEFLEQFYRQGEFTHDSSNPFLNFVSSVLDITIIKPIIEACTGEDLITGEDLTDMERGLKVVFAVVDLVTLGGAIAATKFSEMGLKEGLKAFGKTALIDFAGNTAACGVGALGETFDWPVPITMMLSLAAGITVSISGNKLLFKNADGIEIGSKTLSDAEGKKIGDVLDEGLDINFVSEDLNNILKNKGVTLEEFNALRLRDVSTLSEEERVMFCKQCEVSAFYEHISRMSEDKIRDLIHTINPNVLKKIDEMNWAEYCIIDRYKNPFFKGLRDINSTFEKDRDYISYVGKNKTLNLLTTVGNRDGSKKALMRACGEIVANPNLYEILMDVNCLISRDLETDSIYDGAGDFLKEFEIEEEHIYHCKNIKMEPLEDAIVDIDGGIEND